MEELKKELKHFWETDGEQHFRDEEEILLPVYAQYASINDDPAITEMLVEHVLVRSLVRRITTSDENLINHMHELGELLSTHIRKEERVVFPMIEAALPEAELEKMKPYLHVDKVKTK